MFKQSSNLQLLDDPPKKRPGEAIDWTPVLNKLVGMRMQRRHSSSELTNATVDTTEQCALIWARVGWVYSNTTPSTWT